MSISVGKVHHQIRLRILSCGRVSENHREPEVPEEEVPVVECLDGLARITSEELAITHFVKNGTLQNKSGCRFGEKCSFAHRQVDEHPTKRTKTNNDKSAVALLKKGDWQERESVSDACHDRTGKNLGKEVIRNWDKIHLNVDFLMHGNWVAYFRT